MIPVCLITGFLGSGKTTLLKNHIERTRGRRFAYIVNDFAAVDVDGLLIGAADADVISVPGGSIFCRCLVTDFINTLKRVRKEFPSIEGVVIEASGIASPGVIGDLLAETKLDAVYSLRSVIGVIDPGSVLKLLDTLPAIEEQIRASDILIVNKTDGYDARSLKSVETAIRQINPRAPIIRTQYSDIDIDFFAPNDHTALSGEFALCRDPHYASFGIRPKRGLTRAAVESLLTAHIQSIYRLKGFARLDGSIHYIDVSGGVVSMTPFTGDIRNDELRLALIVPGDEPAVGESIRRAMDAKP